MKIIVVINMELYTLKASANLLGNYLNLNYSYCYFHWFSVLARKSN